MKTTLIITAAGLAAAQLSAAPVDWSKLPPAATATGITFNKDIEPLFKASCVHCHSGDRPKAHLRLDSREGVLKGAKHGPVVKPGDSADSVLVKAVSQLDPEMAMPPKPHVRRAGPGAGGPPPGGEPPRHFGPPPKPLTAEQVGLIRAWIDQGAK